MESWRKNSRKDIVMVDVDTLVPQDHLLRKIEKVMDYEWLYEGYVHIIAQTTDAQEQIPWC